MIDGIIFDLDGTLWNSTGATYMIWNDAFRAKGIDFSMTALFIVICLERVLCKADRLPVAVGGVCAVVSLLVLGPDKFLAPALAATAALLFAWDAARKEAAV